MRNISKRVEEELTKDGGVKRYPGDEFYGGGCWSILSALQGMFYLDIGENNKAIRNAEWIMGVHDKDYNLIEQVKDPKHQKLYEQWCEIFGSEPTKPLLMNHGFSVALFEKLKTISGLE